MNNLNCYHEAHHKYSRSYHEWNKIRAKIKIMAANSRNLEQFIYKIHSRRFLFFPKIEIFVFFEKQSFYPLEFLKKP